MTSVDNVLTFAATLPTLVVFHHVADNWVQTGHQAAHKGLPGKVGQRACAAHVGTYTLITASTVALIWAVFGLHISPAGFIAGQAVSAVTHYWADRRFTLAALAKRLGKEEFYRLGAPREYFIQAAPASAWEARHRVSLDNPSLGTGAYALDQSFHWFWLFVAALLTAVI